MIHGLGVDIAEVDRIQFKLERNPALVKHIYSNVEQAYCLAQKHPYISYAARFAAKEAFLKAFGVQFIGNHHLPEIAVVNQHNGKPELQLSGRTLAAYKELGLGKLLISISHTKVYAVAQVIILLA
jgi:holo-[acyl-carrier protein] synthase